MDTSLEGRLSALLAMSPTELTGMNPEQMMEEAEEEVFVNAITNKGLQEINGRVGRIHICFPEPKGIEFEGRTEFPPSYSTLSSKEKLLLLFSENFRRKFKEKCPNRKPLILCLPNECGIQKFVSTTIKPSTFLFPKLIYNWSGIANFVADHIVYEPLEDPVRIPTRLLSPEAIMKRLKGNSFEMATLLASVLIGNGYPACVVYGMATREVANNDQRRVVCPFIPVENENEIPVEKPKSNKYQIKKPPKLESKYLQEVEQYRLDVLQHEKELEEEEERNYIAQLEALPPDEFLGHRIHAWVVVIQHAQWSYKPEDRQEGEQEAFFIEPSTGFRHESNHSGYLAVEAIWNQHNYYVNIQDPITDIESMHWNVSNTNDWACLLPGEPYECRVDKVITADAEPLTADEELAKEKTLDMPSSWVSALDLSQVGYVERFVNGEKTDFYKRAVYERFAPYHKTDGLLSRLTLFETLDYENPYFRWEWYDNREDLLNEIKIDFRTKQIEEYFEKGRTDSIKAFIHNVEPNEGKIFKFYHTPRFDSLKELHFYSNYIKEYYEARNDRLYYREFKFKKETPFQINEKFDRDPTLKATRNIAERTFFLPTNQVFVKFHYDTDCITASTKMFTKLPESEMGEEVQFVPTSVTGYISNPHECQMTNVELFRLLLSLHTDEDKCIKAFKDRLNEIQKNLYKRNLEFKEPKLKFSIFDPLRNDSARQLRIERYAQMRAREELAKTQLADFLAPYLIRFDKRKPTAEQAIQCKEDCLADFKQYYLEMLNELEARHQELIQEEDSLKRFLHKFQSQFDDFDYEKFVKEGECITRSKRIVSKRIDALAEELNRKYNTLKESLDTDERLLNVEPEHKIRFEE